MIGHNDIGMAVHLISGSDESVVRSTVTDTVHELVGDGDRALMVDEFDGDEYDLADVVAAASTPPFLTEFRIVVARDIGRFGDSLDPLLTYLAEPSPTTHLVLSSGGGRQVKALTDAVKAAGGSPTNTTPPSRARDRQQWFSDRAEVRRLRLRPDAAAFIAETLGEEVGRVDGLLDTLVGAYGEGATVDRDAVEPFVGEAGDVPPWDLTDAIDAGNTTRALTLLGRMTGAGRHPLQIMAILLNHYTRLARLDGADARGEADAAAAMGIKAGYPARKALQLYQRLGSTKVRRAIDLLATADLDLRGARELPDDVVIEVLVARLSRLAT
jgi:DNA polymerase-3 subunit delta